MKSKILITVAPVARVASPDDAVVNPLKPEEKSQDQCGAGKEDGAADRSHGL
jgi:hypothetical protein